MTDIIHESPNPPAPLHERLPILFGPNGLRAGWSLVIAIALLRVFFTGAGFLLKSTHLIPPHAMEHSPGPLPVFLTEAAPFLVVALVTWIMSKVERRPLSVYGLGGTRKLQYLLVGIITGLAASSLLILILVKAGLLVIDQRLLFGSEALRYAVLWIPGFLAIALFEEYLFRGFLQYTLARGLAGLAPRLSSKLNPKAFGFWAAAILVSFGFGAVHSSNPGESPLGLFCAAFASLIFCLSLWRTGSLWWAIGMHAAWDYGQSFLFGVGDSGVFVSPRLLQTHPVGEPLLSGGLTGPEGSVFSLLVLAAIACVIQLTQRPGPNSYAAQMPPHPTQLTPGDSAELPAPTA
ncbi:CPBP family intramembrane glutamic endopeptidase [Edaphobacter aggregans]|uniref:CPBP family intramembrane glutamic endopeptidase n=1 Tax=Edaphobacter aggregans TaxID=570835 RepID=UPI000690FEB4|nr:type II CAAX endopeptidase family protein [Edaphobacter aggregans]